jgi:hypothetical protein
LSNSNPTTPEEIEAEVEHLLDQAIAHQLGMSEHDTDYKLTYISEKLAKVSHMIEALSDIQMKLARISLKVTKQTGNAKSLLALKERQAKDSPEYRAQTREHKSVWLANQLISEQDTAVKWAGLHRVVSEVKEAVAERAQTMKRLDSDIRLHAKLYETKVAAGAAGATSPTSYTGSESPELDLQ